MELLLIICLIALLCFVFMRWFPVSHAAQSQTRISQNDKRHPRYYRGREGEGYDDV